MSFIISFKPVSIGSYSSSRAHTTALPPLPPHRLCFPLKNDRRRFLPLRIRGHSSDTVTPNGGDTKPPNGSLIGAMNSSQKEKINMVSGIETGLGPRDQIFNDALFLLSGPKSRKEFLLEYVRNVQPEFMELFVKRAPKQVVDAMRQTVTNMIGTLPPQFFAITVTTVAENLAQLMYSVIMTGYMFRNAEYRLELQQSLEQVALPDIQDEKDAPDYAPGTQKKVSGEVIRWNKISGPEKMDAVKYIELLEAEIEELSQQLGRKTSEGQNELLEYLKSLEPQNLKDLTSSAGEDVVLAMNTFIKRLLAVSDPAQMKVRSVETSAPELAKLLYWLMVVGYSIRNIEVRFDMDRVLGIPPKLAELPPGENI